MYLFTWLLRKGPHSFDGAPRGPALTPTAPHPPPLLPSLHWVHSRGLWVASKRPPFGADSPYSPSRRAARFSN